MDKVNVYKDEAGEWRWHRLAENNEVVSTSGEGYIRREHAIKMASELNADAELTVEGE